MRQHAKTIHPTNLSKLFDFNGDMNMYKSNINFYEDFSQLPQPFRLFSQSFFLNLAFGRVDVTPLKSFMAFKKGGIYFTLNSFTCRVILPCVVWSLFQQSCLSVGLLA